MFLSYILLLPLLGIVWGHANVYFNLPRDHPGAYQGFVWLESKIVHLIPELQAKAATGHNKTGQICGFKVHHEAIKEFPFVVDLVDKEWGFGEIRVKPHFVIKYGERQKYTFQIEAYDCDQSPNYSERVFVHVDVMNTRGPVFSQTSYSFPVNEGLPVGTIIGQVLAYEESNADAGSDVARDICNYTITMPLQVPFTIDRFGVLRTKTVLNASAQTTYEFYVRAEDCRQPQSRASVSQVTIDVYKVCQPDWKGMPDIINYLAKTGVQPIFTSAAAGSALKLETCGLPCTLPHITSTVRLVGSDLIAAAPSLCRQDQASLTAQRTVCGASRLGIDLLPSPDTVDLAMPPNRSPQTSVLQTNPTSQTFLFDGRTTAWIVPKSRVLLDHVLGQMFTLHFWMKHGAMREKNAKEQILCNSDGEGMNRHHYAVTVHNCKLILLLRREYDSKTRFDYAPAEWRFGPLAQLCNQPDIWHHYTLNYNGGRASLYVDGEPIGEPEVMDDLPLHEAAARVHSTKLVVGACYEGRTGHITQHLRGELAGLILLRGNTEPSTVARCLATCGESLILPNVAQVLQSGMSVSLVSDTIIVSGSDVGQVVTLLSRIGYANLEPETSLRGAQRRIEVSTSYKCSQGTEIPIQDVVIQLNLRTSTPDLLVDINGATEVTLNLGREGTPIFPDLQFTAVTTSNAHPAATAQGGSASDTLLLDSCVVRPMAPNRTLPQTDALIWPTERTRKLGLLGFSNKHGLVIEGLRPAGDYAILLRQIVYRIGGARAAAHVTEFSLACSQEEGKHTSKDFSVKLVADSSTQHGPRLVHVADDPPIAPVLQHAGHEKPLLISRQHSLDQGQSNLKDSTNLKEESQVQSVAGNWVAVIVVMSIVGGFLVLLAVVGVIRLRRSCPDQKKGPRGDQPAIADVRPFHLTVNPLDEEANVQRPVDDDCENDTSPGSVMSPREAALCSEEDDDYEEEEEEDGEGEEFVEYLESSGDEERENGAAGGEQDRRRVRNTPQWQVITQPRDTHPSSGGKQVHV